MKCRCRVILGMLVLARAGMADDPKRAEQTPQQMLRTKLNGVVSLLQQKDMDPNERGEKIAKLVTPIFDFALMAKLTLGRKHWPRLTARQRDTFSRLFIEHLKEYCREKLMLYTNEKVVFKPAVRGKTKSQVHIPTILVSKDKDISILYKLHNRDKKWKIYDVEIQGVSIVVTYRSQFDEMLRKGTVEDFLTELKKLRQKPTEESSKKAPKP